MYSPENLLQARPPKKSRAQFGRPDQLQSGLHPKGPRPDQLSPGPRPKIKLEETHFGGQLSNSSRPNCSFCDFVPTQELSHFGFWERFPKLDLSNLWIWQVWQNISFVNLQFWQNWKQKILEVELGRALLAISSLGSTYYFTINPSFLYLVQTPWISCDGCNLSLEKICKK